MAYTLIQNLTTVNYTSGNSGRKYIVIHYTGNTTDTAANNAAYFKSVNRGASAHYFVDASQVVQVVADANTAWAVGVNYGTNNLFGTCTNANSLNIEMCSTNGKISDETFSNTVTLTRTLMSKYNIDASKVVRHYDVCSKNCPGWTGWVGSDESIWKKFKEELTSTGASTNSTSTSTSTLPNAPFTVKVLVSDLNIRASASMSGTVKGQTGKGTFTITKTSNGWGYLKSGAGWIYLLNSSYCTIEEDATEAIVSASNCPYSVRVTISNLNIRKGPATSYASRGYTGAGTFTIVEESDGWGLLKAYQSGRDGWISLSYATKI